MKLHGYDNLMNYIDDLIYKGLPSKIHQSYQFVLSLLQDLGLQVSQSKLVAPQTQVTCLGIVVDTINSTISLPAEKLQEIHDVCTHWTSKSTCTKRQLQSLLGSLLYITKCIRSARFFLNRMLQVLKDSHSTSYTNLSQEFHSDLKQYNGVTFFNNKPVTFSICPSPLTEFQHLHINQLEMLNVVVALKVWSQLLADKKVKIHCDNQAVVEVLTTRKTKDPFLATCARNIWLITAIFNIEIIVIHVPGKHNHIADLLSRWMVTVKPEHKLRQYLPNFIWINIHIDLTKLNLCI